jgi:hypothetical protein
MTMKARRLAARSGCAVCPVCRNKKMLVEHHIHGRDFPEKNRRWNRCWVCASCHDEIHAGKVILEGYISTTEGMKLGWHKLGDEPLSLKGSNTHIYGK